MIQQDEQILFVTQARCAVAIKLINSVSTGMSLKKIVVTTHRCLFFDSLSNQVAEIEYEILRRRGNLQQQKRDKQKQKQIPKRTSVTQLPQYYFYVDERDCKIVIDEQKSIHQHLRKIGLMNLIKSVVGIVLLKNPAKLKFQLVAFQTLHDGFRFCRALECARAWIKYEQYCASQKIQLNLWWIRILVEIINKQNAIALIDPQLFITGSGQQIKSFIYLMNLIPFAHTFEHRYSIINYQASGYATKLLQSFQTKTHSLFFRNNSMTSIYLETVFNANLKFQHIMNLNLSHNKLTDDAFVTIQRISKQGGKLSFIDISYNNVDFNNVILFTSFIKSTQVKLNLNLSYNQIGDWCVEHLQRCIIMAQNTPIEEINLSYNKFSRKKVWRLFVGNQRFYSYHTQMNFIIYPIPISKDIFPLNQAVVRYPHPQPLMNFNIHSALVQQFQQQSFMRHTLHQISATKIGSILKLLKQVSAQHKLPNTKQQVLLTLQLANKIENFINTPQFVETMEQLANEIVNFQFNLSPVSKNHYIKFLCQKLNEALVVRDHYAVKYILRALRILQVSYEGYKPRLDNLAQRSQLFSKKVSQIFNFQVDEFDINERLDEMVREGLRLYLTGNGVETLYYLKYLRDKCIERLIQTKVNPEHQIYQKMIQRNMKFDDQITEKQLIVPYEIRVQKTIRQNFYLHPWKANYFALAKTPQQQYQQCLKFLEKSSKHAKFAPYFNRIQQRIEFMKNEFNMFLYGKFRISYSDLKINCARLLSMYYFIITKAVYSNILATRKLPVNRQKNVTIATANQKRFINDYHINNYHNINQTAKSTGLYRYRKKFTKYINDKFNKEFHQLLLPKMDKLFNAFAKLASSNKDLVTDDTVDDIIKILKVIKQSAYPTQLKEEFYLRVICWREGRLNNDVVLRYLPFFTMYMRPPLALEKFIIAEILDKPSLVLGDLPLSIVSDIARVSDISIEDQERNYIDRDWMGSSKMLAQLMRSNCKVQIRIQFLNDTYRVHRISQSSTVRQLVQLLINSETQIQDVKHFWLYMGYGTDLQLFVLQEDQHIGQILSQKQERPKYFVFKRRIYCPQWKYIYQKYSQVILNSLYFDTRCLFLQGYFFISQQDIIDMVSSIFILDTVDKLKHKQDFKKVIDSKIRDLGNLYASYLPERALQKVITKSKAELISELKQKINEKVMKKEHLKSTQTKKVILRKLEENPQFFTSNYTFIDRNKKVLIVSMNWLQVVVNAELQTQKIGLQKIVQIAPMSKYLSISYHKQESSSLGKVMLYGEQNKILSTAQDLLSYCMIRIKMHSASLYTAYRYQTQVDKSVKGKQSAKIRKKLSLANPTILQQNIIPYFNQSKYIRKRKPRKLYPNQSLQKLQTKDDQLQIGDNQQFRTIQKNPQHRIIYSNLHKQSQNKKSKDLKYNEDDENVYPQNNLNQSQLQVPTSLAHAQYDKIASNFTEDALIANQPIERMLLPPNRIMPPIQSIIEQKNQSEDEPPPPKLIPIRQTKPTLTKNEQPIEPSPQVSTAPKGKGRVVPRQNR